MEVYRICLEEHSHSLFASGKRNRWNSKDNFVIYTSANRSLAYLENLVHRSGEGTNSIYHVMVIYVPDHLKIDAIHFSSLPNGWHEVKNYPVCQAIGDPWYKSQSSPVLKVPSSIMPLESIYVLNSRHPDFSQIQLVGSYLFALDPRLPSL